MWVNLVPDNLYKLKRDKNNEIESKKDFEGNKVEKKASNGQKRLKSIWNKNPFTNYDFANRIEFPLRECLHFGCVSTNFSSLP